MALPFRISNFEFRNPRNWGLYLVTDRHQIADGDLVAVVGQALQAGVRAVQLREKDLATRDLFDLGGKLLALTQKAGAALLINDRLDLAMALSADGVHLTRRSLPPREARAILGPEKLVGISCHSLAEVQEAEDGGVDFIVLGPIFATPSKARYGPPLTTAVLRQARSSTSLPLLAIGGINSVHVSEAMAAGADGVSVISAVMAAQNPTEAAAELLAAVAAVREGRRGDSTHERSAGGSRAVSV